MPPNGPANAPARRFSVALSFPGEHRARVAAIAGLLAAHLGRGAVFYDDWYTEELNGKNLAVYLLELYRDQADVVVYFHCQAYVQKRWCGVEWNAGLDLLLDGDQTDRLMFMRFDESAIPGLPRVFGYRNIATLPDATIAAEILQRVDRLNPTASAPAPTNHPANVAKLPTTDDTLIGRDAELAQLEEAWNTQANLLQIIAPGGIGKTALMTKWYRNHLGEVPLLGWSFYRQGTGENANTSSDAFLEYAITHWGLTPQANTADAKAAALVHHLRQHKTLLILDGLEPLQNQSNGYLNDYALKDLLRELAAQNPGLVLCTTRVRLVEIPDTATAHSLELDNLTPEDGARLLREKYKIHGESEDLLAASEAYGNHALALTLLGTYLKRKGGDISHRFEIAELPAPATKPGDHAKRVMQSYWELYQGKPEADILRALGFFDRPAEREALRLVLPGPLDEDALLNLQEARLIDTASALAPIDCHPLVREHFGALTRSQDPEGWRAGHSRLFDYYCKLPEKEQPDTLEELTPLFHAVAHGCQAGRYLDVLDRVYFDRILRRPEEFYLLHKLGAFGTNLSLLAHFFERPWRQPVATLSGADHAWVLGTTAVSLRALGRLADGVEPMFAGAEAVVRQRDWKNAARAHNSLSELLLFLGRTQEAVAAARRAVDYADRSRDPGQRIFGRGTLADALHQASPPVDGEAGYTETLRLFAEAERLQGRLQPNHPLLYALQGYHYCDLLLGQSAAEALSRATQALAIAQDGGAPLLMIGLDHLTLGRAHAALGHEADARHHLDQAALYLRRAGTQHMLPLALLARATEADLAEVHQIATRSGMLLHLTDYHLAMARRHRSLEHLEQAEKLIEQTGYHRRDPEAAALRHHLTANPPNASSHKQCN